MRLRQFFGLLLLPLLAQSQDTLHYSIVKGGEKAGEQKIWFAGPHEFHSTYFFTDRGRGDSVEAAITTNDSGLITRVETHGVDYFKKPFHESFSIAGDSGVTVVNDERKAKLFKGEFFQSAEPTDIEPGTEYLLRHPGDTLQLAAGGTIVMTAPHDRPVRFGDGMLALRLCEFYVNRNSPPNFVWVDGDGRFFASVSDWFSTIRSGYESLCDSLNLDQLMQSKAYYGSQMKSLADPLSGGLAIRNVRLYDSENAKLLDRMTVIVHDGTVTSVEEDASAKVPDGCAVIDGKDKTLLPGLWDMHGHYYEGEGLSYLAGGVTHVRDMGNGKRLPAIRDAIRNNELLGPDISYISGFIDQAGPFQGPTGRMIHNLDEGLRAVDDYAKLGYNQIKLYSSIDPTWVAPMAAEAHRLGLRVCGHIPAFETADRAVRDGYDEITHMNMVILNFEGDTIDTRGMKRFSVVGQHAKDIDLDGDAVNAFVRLLKEKHTSLDPTMSIFAGMMTVSPGDTDGAMKPVAQWMPADRRENLAAKSSFFAASERTVYAASWDKTMKFLKKLYDEGILIVSGTDGGEAFALEHELELYVEAGIPPLNALQCATWNAAKDCRLTDTYGSIRAGKPADMILVDGNPAAKISDIRRVELVIKNGRQYSPKKLLSSIGWGYYY